MKSIPARLRMFIVLVAVASIGLVGLAGLGWTPGAWRMAWSLQAVLFACLIALAKLHPVLLAPGSKFGFKVSVATAPIFAALFLLGTPGALVAVTAGVIVANVVARRRWH